MQKEYVVGLGDNVVDYYQNQNVKYPGGNAVNFAVFAPKELVKAYYVGSIADDQDGDLILASLKKHQVDTTFCNRIDGKTEKTIVNLVDGDRQFVSSVKGPRKLPELTEHKLAKILTSALVVYSACHANAEKELGQIHRHGITTAFDFSEMAKYHTNEYLERVAKNVDIAQFSLAEAQATEVTRILHLCKEQKTKLVLFTNGSKPSLLFDCQNNRKYIGNVIPISHPVDTMGAGDTFFANLVTYLLTENSCLRNLSEQTCQRALNKAAIAAAKTIKQPGSFGCGERIH